MVLQRLRCALNASNALYYEDLEKNLGRPAKLLRPYMYPLTIYPRRLSLVFVFVCIPLLGLFCIVVAPPSRILLLNRTVLSCQPNSHGISHVFSVRTLLPHSSICTDLQVPVSASSHHLQSPPHVARAHIYISCTTSSLLQSLTLKESVHCTPQVHTGSFCPPLQYIHSQSRKLFRLTYNNTMLFYSFRSCSIDLLGAALSTFSDCFGWVVCLQRFLDFLCLCRVV